jgi:hypothetical protein
MICRVSSVVSSKLLVVPEKEQVIKDEGNCITGRFIICTVLNVSRTMKPRCARWAGHVVRMGRKRNVLRILVGQPEGKRLYGRLRRR